MGHTMRAWVVDSPGRSTPVRCGVSRGRFRYPDRSGACTGLRMRRCRTDLHLAEGDLSPKRPRVVPGHEVVGVVDRLGTGCSD